MDKTVSVAAWIKIAGTSPEANYIVSKGEWNQAYSLGCRMAGCAGRSTGRSCRRSSRWKKASGCMWSGRSTGGRCALYVDGELQASLGGGGGAATGWFTRKADDLPGQGREVAVVSRVIGADGLDLTLKPGETVTVATAILSDLDAPDIPRRPQRSWWPD